MYNNPMGEHLWVPVMSKVLCYQ